MNRNRRSVSKTPVQKTNLFHFFQRTPASVNRQVDCTPNQTDSTIGTPSCQNSSVTPFLTKTKPPVECPACNKLIPFYKLNRHLDNECATLLGVESPSTNLHQPKSERIIDLTVPEIPIIKLDVVESKTVTPDHRPTKTISETKHPSPKKLDFTSPSSPSSNVGHHVKEFHSSTKKTLSLRRKQIVGQVVGIKGRQAKSDPKEITPSSQPLGHPSWAGVKKKLFLEEETSMPGLPYYLETFLFLLKSTFDEPLHHRLFCEEDHRLYQTFQSLSLDAQKLYVRLFSRKFQWRRREKIAYDDISTDLAPALTELCSASLLLGIDNLEDLPTLMGLLTQPEVKQIFKESKIPFNGKGNAVQVTIKNCLLSFSRT